MTLHQVDSAPFKLVIELGENKELSSFIFFPKQTLGIALTADDKGLTGESKNAFLSVLKKGGSILHIFLSLPVPPVPTSAAGGNASPRRPFDPLRSAPQLSCRAWITPASAASTSIAVRLAPSKQKLFVIRPLLSVRSSWDMDFGSKDSAERYCGHGGRIYRLPWLSTSRAMEMENPLEPVAEDKEETSHQDDRADVVAGGRDKLPNAIPLVLPLPEFLSSCPLPPGIRQQSPERKEKEVEKSNFLSDVPTKILNSSPLPSVTEHQGASNDSEIGSEELKLSFCCANANFKLLDCATRNETAEP
ncbi:hypothetical protein ZIOFF_049650 [Zingiber officinale]|uniref:Uncharacterized protein n=1 Tax=Zingiber officinale TaxID=94328 RepID=A0A8J5FHL2_ZINOF|nr:hypothetical protein ZIOFF_049650 [Zingiber officinale]